MFKRNYKKKKNVMITKNTIYNTILIIYNYCTVTVRRQIHIHDVEYNNNTLLLLVSLNVPAGITMPVFLLFFIRILSSDDRNVTSHKQYVFNYIFRFGRIIYTIYLTVISKQSCLIILLLSYKRLLCSSTRLDARSNISVTIV